MAKKKPELMHYETEVHVYCGDEAGMLSLIGFLLRKRWWFKVEWHNASEFRLTCNADPHDLRKARIAVDEMVDYLAD